MPNHVDGLIQYKEIAILTKLLCIEYFKRLFPRLRFSKCALLGTLIEIMDLTGGSIHQTLQLLLLVLHLITILTA